MQCYLYPTYVDTKANHLADSLSHNNVSLFLSNVLSDNAHPAIVWTCYWICRLIRPLRSGASISEILYFQAGLVPSTQKTKFTLCYYASYLAEKGLAPQHIPGHCAECPDFNGTPRPMGALVPTPAQTGPSWYQYNQALE